MKMIRARKFYQQQFGKIQEYTGMSPKTLQFHKNYEEQYLAYNQPRSVIRVRFCFIIGLLALGFYLWYGLFQDSYKASPYKSALNVLSVLTLAAFLIGVILSFIPKFYSHLETITFVVFLTVSLCLVIKKPIEQAKGPILPLVILLIPIYGITRMRFLRSCILGWTIFFTYFIVQLVAQAVIERNNDPAIKGPIYDSKSEIVYQTINYGISIIGGMVSHYRQVHLFHLLFSIVIQHINPVYDA